MAKVTTKELLEAGVHFGHLTRKWDPRMAPNIFMERNGIHIIDLNKTAEALENAKVALTNIAKSGRKIIVKQKLSSSRHIPPLVRRFYRISESWLFC